MAQDRSRSGHGNFRGPNPNRDRKREPATIEGEVVSGTPAASPAPSGPGAASDGKPASPSSSQPPAPSDAPASPPAGGTRIQDPGPATAASGDTEEPSPKAIAPETANPLGKGPATAPEPKPAEPVKPAGSVPSSTRESVFVTPSARETASQTASSHAPDAAKPASAAANGAKPEVRKAVSAAPGDTAPAAGASATGSRMLLPALASLMALLLSGAALYTALSTGRGGAAPADLASLAQRLDRAESRLSGVDQKVAALDARPAAAPVDLAPLSARIDAAEQAARAAESRAQQRPEPPAAPRVDLTPLDTRIAALEARPAPSFDPAPLDRRIADLEAELAPLKKMLETPKTEVRATQEPVVGTPPGDAAALAVVAQSLRDKLDRGAPYRAELAALEKLGVDAGRVAPLKAMADKGAPGAQALLQSFRTIASATAQAGRQTDPPAQQTSATAGFFDRLTRNAASLVRIRPVGDAPGDDSGALVSRIETALERGDVRQAVAQWDALPPAAQQSSRDWAERARTRAEADASVRQILDEAIERLGRTQ